MSFSLKDYEIIQEIGRGGFASVYRARQKSLSREVALKRLAPQRTQNSTDIIRFRREAEAMASLKHDNIIVVLDYAFWSGNYYIVMEYIDGMSLETALENRMPRGCALFVLEKVAGALEVAHGQNIIHRDIKPANILLGRNGQVKLADFGLALFHAGIESCSAPGSVLGTISYMAPEALASPRDVDCRIDVFSFGCILYQVLADKHPFAGATFGEISYRILNEEPQPLDSSTLPASLAQIAIRSLQKDREKRPSAAEIHNMLKTVLEGKYHASQEELMAFVRNGRTISGDDGQAAAAVALPLQAKMRKKVFLIPAIVVWAGVAVLLAAFVYFSHPFFSSGRTHVAPLPELPASASPAGMEMPRNMTLTARAGKSARKDGPAPLSSSAMDMKVGTLILQGVSAQDTIFLNGRKFQKQPQKGQAAYELRPGYYRLEIKRNGRPPFSRELELVPYQRQIIDINR